MKFKLNSWLNYVIIALIFFFLGVVLSPDGKFLRFAKKKLEYTKSISQKLYDGWEKDRLFFGDGSSLKDFEDSNETYVIYFWASWCPHCKNVNADVNSLKNADLPLIALTFDRERADYDSYRSEKPVFWKDLFQKDDSGELVFCPREDSYNIPSIPSLWVVSKGKVKELYRGEEGIKKFVGRKLHKN